MNLHRARSTDEWQTIGHLAAEALSGRQQGARFFWRRRSSASDAIQKFIEVVYDSDVAAFSEERFLEADKILADMLGSIENHLTMHVDHRDRAQFHFMGEAIRQLREARHWIAQGFSPRAERRPSDAEIRGMVDECAVGALRALRSGK